MSVIKQFITACHTRDLKTLKSFDYSQIDIHAYHDMAIVNACRLEFTEVVQFLISMSVTHGAFNFEVFGDKILRYARAGRHMGSCFSSILISHVIISFRENAC